MNNRSPRPKGGRSGLPPSSPLMDRKTPAPKKNRFRASDPPALTGGNGGNSISDVGDDIITPRRAELRRLQRLRAASASGGRSGYPKDRKSKPFSSSSFSAESTTTSEAARVKKAQAKFRSLPPSGGAAAGGQHTPQGRGGGAGAGRTPATSPRYPIGFDELGRPSGGRSVEPPAASIPGGESRVKVASRRPSKSVGFKTDNPATDEEPPAPDLIACQPSSKPFETRATPNSKPSAALRQAYDSSPGTPLVTPDSAALRQAYGSSPDSPLVTPNISAKAEEGEGTTSKSSPAAKRLDRIFEKKEAKGGGGGPATVAVESENGNSGTSSTAVPTRPTMSPLGLGSIKKKHVAIPSPRDASRGSPVASTALAVEMRGATPIMCPQKGQARIEGLPTNPNESQLPMAHPARTLHCDPAMGQPLTNRRVKATNTGPSMDQRVKVKTETVGLTEDARVGGNEEPLTVGGAIPLEAKVKQNGADATATSPESSDTKEPKKEKKQQTQPSDPDQHESLGAEDALVNFIFFIVSTVFGLFFALFVRLPLKIFKTALVMLTMCALVMLLWLYLADDNGAMSMGAGIDYRFNIPGIL